LERTLKFTRDGRKLNLQEHAAWQILHGVLAFGRNFEVGIDPASAQRVVALDWALGGKPLTGWRIAPTEYGLRAEMDPGKRGQGHEDQWLAILSQSGIGVNDPLQVGDTQYKVYDLLRRALYDCYEGKESSWTLIALAGYLDPLDQQWSARDGETWTVQRLAGMEAGPLYEERAAAEHVNEAACGGTHRLIGLAMSLNRHRRDHPDSPLTGGWLAAQERVAWGIAQAKANQLPSGAFSILYFSRPANSASIHEHLASTGHTLEFLSLALPREQLEATWVKRGVVYLCDLLERTRDIDLECGALYHAVHGLVLYHDRVFGATGDQAPKRTAEQGAEGT
jgi:hypothetical protein